MRRIATRGNIPATRQYGWIFAVGGYQDECGRWLKMTRPRLRMRSGESLANYGLKTSFRALVWWVVEERDGIFVTEDLVNIVECTVSRRKDKAVDDRRKLVDAARELRKKYPDKLMKGWFIGEPLQASIAVSDLNL